jgi:hypothetical protein
VPTVAARPRRWASAATSSSYGWQATRAHSDHHRRVQPTLRAVVVPRREIARKRRFFPHNTSFVASALLSRGRPLGN